MASPAPGSAPEERGTLRSPIGRDLSDPCSLTHWPRARLPTAAPPPRLPGPPRPPLRVLPGTPINREPGASTPSHALGAQASRADSRRSNQRQERGSPGPRGRRTGSLASVRAAAPVGHRPSGTLRMCLCISGCSPQPLVGIGLHVLACQEGRFRGDGMGDTDLKWAQLPDPPKRPLLARQTASWGLPPGPGIWHLASGSWRGWGVGGGQWAPTADSTSAGDSFHPTRKHHLTVSKTPSTVRHPHFSDVKMGGVCS